jgi:DNA-directed RNA polymerase subunit alpha
LIELFIPFLHAEEEKLHLENNQQKVTLHFFTCHDRLAKLKKNPNEIALKSIYIDQSELPLGFISASKGPIYIPYWTF